MYGRLIVRFMMVTAWAAAVAGPALAHAQQTAKKPNLRAIQQRMGGQQRWWQDEAIATELALTADQIQRLDEMADRGKEQMGPIRQRYFQEYRAFMDTLSDYGSSQDAIQQQRAALEQARTESVTLTVDQILEMRSILTPEQWAELPKLAPRALRIGSVSYRGSGVVTPGQDPDVTDQ